MSILDRIMLTLLALAGVCIAVLAVVAGTGALGGWTAGMLDGLATYPANVYTIVIGVVFALICVRFLFYRLNGREVDYVVLPGEFGRIRISFQTIQQLANRTGKTVRGVQELDTRVRNGQAGILLSTKVRALPDLDLAHMSAEIQAAVKEYVERTSGVTVEHITVNVMELAGGAVKSTKTWVE